VEDKKASNKMGQLFGVKSPCKLDFIKLNQEGIATEVRKPRSWRGFLASFETTMKNPISSSY